MSNRPHRRPDEEPSPRGRGPAQWRPPFPQTEHDPLTIEGRIEQYGLLAEGTKRVGASRVLLWSLIGVFSIFALVVIVALVVSALA